MGLLYGFVCEDADALPATPRGRHPVVWAGFVGVNPVLNVHTGPRALGAALFPTAGAVRE